LLVGRKEETGVIYKEATNDAPCKRACPAGIDIPRYIRLINQKDYDGALAVIRERNPLPAVCGRVCYHPCEDACQEHHNHPGGPVAINALKRFVTEHVSPPPKPRRNKPSGKQVAVVGSGPAGLTASYYLSMLGHNVTIFEAYTELGGMMRYGIPEYRLPRAILDKDIDFIINEEGIEVKTDTKVEDLDTLFEEGYDAILVAVGAHKNVELGIKNDDLALDCLSFLKDINSGKTIDLGNRVAVIGGGNASVDAARTALRLGSKEVTILYRRSWDEMPANPSEIKEAINEGVDIRFLVSPKKIERKNNGLILEAVRMVLSKPDVSGRQRPIPIEGGEFVLEVDTLISAAGQVPEVLSFNLLVGELRTIQASRGLSTSKPGIFAGGDCVRGPASVIEAIAAGKRAAISINEYLGGIGYFPEESSSYEEKLPPFLPEILFGEKVAIPKLPIKDRISGFNEVELTFPEKEALREANRCLWCDLPILVDPTKCVGCLSCTLSCSINFEGTFNPSNARIKIVPPDRSINIGEASISFIDECKHCGICVASCLYGALTRGLITDDVKDFPKNVIVSKN
jgi:formate dehydrogenase beta subunit